MKVLQPFFKSLDDLKASVKGGKVNLWIFLACCLLIICEAFPWSYRWSGVLSMTQSWDLPRGFVGIVDFHGLWPLCTENLYYLDQIQSFLGVEGASISLASAFELQRTLYAVLVKTLWFIHPLLAGILVNILIWMLCCYCLLYIIKTFSPSLAAQVIGGVLIAAGQGFLTSVGEISPHMIGYGAHYLIFALACRQRVWQQPFNLNDHLVLYATIGLIQFGYDSAWLSLPLLLPISVYCIYRESILLFKKILYSLALFLTAVLPSLSFSLFTSLLLSKGGILAYMYNLLQTMGIVVLAKNLSLTLVEGILAYGPIIVPAFLLSLVYALRQKNHAILYLWLNGLLLFILCGILMLPVGGRGYVTFSFSAIIILLSTYALFMLWNHRSCISKGSIVVLLFTYVLYNNSPLLSSYFGNNWVLQGFTQGYINAYQNSNLYRSFECYEFN